MSRRILPAALLAGALTALVPASPAQARCYGDPTDPRYAVCVTTCAVYAALEVAYC